MNWICSLCQHWLGAAFVPAHQRSVVFITTNLCRSWNWNFWQCYFSIWACTHINGTHLQALVAYRLFPVTSFLPSVIAGIVFILFFLFSCGMLTGPWLWLLLSKSIPLSKLIEPIISTVLCVEVLGNVVWNTNKWLPLFTKMKPSFAFWMFLSLPLTDQFYRCLLLSSVQL